jgi:hypothetical protein
VQTSVNGTSGAISLLCVTTTTGGGGGGGSQVDTHPGDCRFDDGTVNPADRPTDVVGPDGILIVGTCDAGGNAATMSQPGTAGQFLVATTSVPVGATSLMTLSLVQPILWDVTIHLSSSDPTAASIPATVVLHAGQTSVDIPVTGHTEGLTIPVTVTASWQDQITTATVNVTLL